jgi:hypothetical protein
MIHAFILALLEQKQEHGRVLRVSLGYRDFVPLTPQKKSKQYKNAVCIFWLQCYMFETNFHIILQ